MRLTELRYPKAVIDDVCTLIELHLRFHGYGESAWSDAAVRRFVRDAGPLLDRLNQLTRADVTTRNEKRAEAFAKLQDELEERIAALAEQENLEAMRPPLDGRQVMERARPRARPRDRGGARLPDGAPARARPDPRGRGDRARCGPGRPAADRTAGIPGGSKDHAERIGVASPVRPDDVDAGPFHQVPKHEGRDTASSSGPSTGRNSGSRSIGETSQTTPIHEGDLRAARHARVAQQVFEQQHEVRQQAARAPSPQPCVRSRSTR